MLQNKSTVYLYDYFYEWIELYKVGAIRQVTLDKYYLAYRHLRKIAPHLTMGELNRQTYQSIINEFARTHEKQTTMDFHHQIKSCILDAYDDGVIMTNPTRKTIIKGKTPAPKKVKYISQYELHALTEILNLEDTISLDWLILLIAKTGLRFSEALGVTPKDFDFEKQTLTINKTWNYKSSSGGFEPTKNTHSNRTIALDWKLLMQFSRLTAFLPEDQPIFVDGRIYNSTINNLLERYCEKANVPIITIHGLRHTHASVLLYAGVSIASVAKRLGHANMTTTQNTYLHIIRELESQDMNKVMNVLAGI